MFSGSEKSKKDLKKVNQERENATRQLIQELIDEGFEAEDVKNLRFYEASDKLEKHRMKKQARVIIEREEREKNQKLEAEKIMKEEKKEQNRVNKLRNERPTISEVSEQMQNDFIGGFDTPTENTRDYLKIEVSGSAYVIYFLEIYDKDDSLNFAEMCQDNLEVANAINSDEYLYERFHADSEFKDDIEDFDGKYLTGEIGDSEIIVYFEDYDSIEIGSSWYFDKITKDRLTNDSSINIERGRPMYLRKNGSLIGEIIYERIAGDRTSAKSVALMVLEEKKLEYTEIVYSDKDIPDFRRDGKTIFYPTKVEIDHEIYEYSGDTYDAVFTPSRASVWSVQRLKTLTIEDLWNADYLELLKEDLNRNP